MNNRMRNRLSEFVLILIGSAPTISAPDSFESLQPSDQQTVIDFLLTLRLPSFPEAFTRLGKGDAAKITPHRYRESAGERAL